MANDEQDAFAALRARFQDQSRRAQTYYAVMHEARGVLGGDDAASSWMEQPLAQLDGRTPAQLVAAGQHEQVLMVLRALQR